MSYHKRLLMIMACALVSAQASAKQLVFSGRIVPNPLAVITAPVDGELQTAVSANSPVSPDQLLAQFRAPQLEENVHQLWVELQQLDAEIALLNDWSNSYEYKSAEHSLANAILTEETSCQRYAGSQRLYEHGLISKEEIEAEERQCILASRARQLSEAHMKATHDRGNAEHLEQIKERKKHVWHRYEAQKALESSLTFKSGQAGILLPKYDAGTSLWQEGASVQAGKVVAIVADKEVLLVTLKVDEFDVVHLKPEMTANIQLTAYPQTPVTGVLTSIDYMPAEENDRAPIYQATVQFSPEQLEGIDWRYGFSVTVSIES